MVAVSLQDRFRVHPLHVSGWVDVSVSVSAEYSLVPQRYHSEEEVPARHRLVVTDW